MQTCRSSVSSPNWSLRCPQAQTAVFQSLRQRSSSGWLGKKWAVTRCLSTRCRRRGRRTSRPQSCDSVSLWRTTAASSSSLRKSWAVSWGRRRRSTASPSCGSPSALASLNGYTPPLFASPNQKEYSNLQFSHCIPTMTSSERQRRRSRPSARREKGRNKYTKKRGRSVFHS